MINLNNRGLSLLEAFLAAFIFITSVAAIFVTMNGLRKPAVNNERKLEAALILRDYLEDMRSKVDANNYDSATMQFTSGVLKDGNHPNGADPENPIKRTGSTSLVDYTISYTVTTEASGVKNVFATITWPDTLN